MIQNVLYLLGCLTFRIYFLICFWPHSFYYETIFYYLIHVLFFYMEVLLDLICLLYKFGMLIWQIIILLMILLHVWSSVLVWAFYYSASYLIIFLKYIFLLYFVCVNRWKFNWSSIKVFLYKRMIWKGINFLEIRIWRWTNWVISFLITKSLLILLFTIWKFCVVTTLCIVIHA